MILDKLKKILPTSEIAYPNDFKKIISNIFPEDDPDAEVVKFVWEAYNYSKEAHKGQLRRSGEPYFTHCSAVGIILSEWKQGIQGRDYALNRRDYKAALPLRTAAAPYIDMFLIAPILP